MLLQMVKMLRIAQIRAWKITMAPEKTRRTQQRLPMIKAAMFSLIRSLKKREKFCIESTKERVIKNKELLMYVDYVQWVMLCLCTAKERECIVGRAANVRSQLMSRFDSARYRLSLGFSKPTLRAGSACLRMARLNKRAKSNRGRLGLKGSRAGSFMTHEPALLLARMSRLRN